MSWTGARIACTVLSLAIAVPGLSASAQTVKETRDVAYGPSELERLDIYQPEDAEGRRPAVIWIHGGGWREGDKREGANGIGSFAAELVRHGYVAVACNYRLVPKDLHPAQVDDVQRVVRWLRGHADEYGTDPERIGAAGISAGGHLAAMLAVRETRAKQGDELDRYSSRVAAAVSLNGPTDLRDAPELTTAILKQAVSGLAGDAAREAEVIADASPVRFVDKDAAPVLFVVGSADPWVPNAHAEQLAAALKAKGVESEVVVLEGAGHGIFPSTTPAARDATIKWFDERLK